MKIDTYRNYKQMPKKMMRIKVKKNLGTCRNSALQNNSPKNGVGVGYDWTGGRRG